MCITMFERFRPRRQVDVCALWPSHRFWSPQWWCIHEILGRYTSPCNIALLARAPLLLDPRSQSTFQFAGQRNTYRGTRTVQYNACWHAQYSVRSRYIAAWSYAGCEKVAPDPLLLASMIPVVCTVGTGCGNILHRRKRPNITIWLQMYIPCCLVFGCCWSYCMAPYR